LRARPVQVLVGRVGEEIKITEDLDAAEVPEA
jgi:hypothetical protein